MRAITTVLIGLGGYRPHGGLLQIFKLVQCVQRLTGRH